MIETEHRLLPSGLKVREAREYDVDALARLMGGQNAYHADLVPHIVKAVSIQGTRAWCKAQLADPAMTIFLADTEQSRAVGALMLHIKIYPDTSVMHGVKICFIDELFVLADVRRRGIGKALIARARAHAVTAACDGLSLNVWSAYTKAIEAYEALNFETVYQRMTLSLDP